MKISILAPSFRSTNSAIGRYLQLGDLDPSKYEIIIRDNSESIYKKKIFKEINSNCIKYIEVENKGGYENFSSLVELSNEEYSLFYADDDYLYTSGLEAAHSKLLTLNEKSHCGLTFNYLVTSSNIETIHSYNNAFDKNTASERLISYAESMDKSANLLYYSIYKTEALKMGMRFLNMLPYRFSHCDQLFSIFMLLIGKIPSIDHILYSYDMSEWNTLEKAYHKDRSYYESNGVDPDIFIIHYLVQAIEGYFLINSKLAKDITNEDLSNSAEIWLMSKLKNIDNIFKKNNLSSSTATLCFTILFDLKNKDHINPHELLNDVSSVIAISDKEKSKAYNSFWKYL